MKRLAAAGIAGALAVAALTAAPAQAATCTTSARIANVKAYGSGQTVSVVAWRLNAPQRFWTNQPSGNTMMSVYRTPICNSGGKYVYVTYRNGKTDKTWPGWVIVA